MAEDAVDAPDEQPRAFAILGAELVEIQHRIAALHGQLAADYDPTAEAELDTLRREREEKLYAWARRALQWQLDGGVVTLHGAVADGLVVDEDDDDDETLHGEEADPGGSILDSVVLGPAWTTSGPVELGSLERVERAQAVLARLPPPRPAPLGEAWFEEANAVHRELLDVGVWSSFPRGVQHALTGHLAARLRRLQDDAPAQVKVVIQLQLKKDFARLGQFSGDHQPGWVAGLGRHNPPEHGDWTADAEICWQTLQRELGALAMDAEMASLNPEVALGDLDTLLREGAGGVHIRRGAIRALNAGVSPDDSRLTRLLVPHLEALAGDKGLKRLRKAVRAVTASTVVTDSEPPPDASPPEDWPLWALTRGKSAVMVGGEPREPARQRVAEAFAFGSLAWETGYDIRGVQRLAERIRGGGIDMVLLLARFISHKVTDVLVPALREAGIPWAMVERGYGVGGIRAALERYLADHPDP